MVKAGEVTQAPLTHQGQQQNISNINSLLSRVLRAEDAYVD